jgi:sulfur carrier protein
MEAPSMRIKLNGEDRDVPEGSTLGAVLASLRLQPGRLACEVNLDIVKRADYDRTALKPGDTVEIVQMIGGG